MAILTQLNVLLPQGSVVTSLQEASASRTAFHTCCSHNQWSAKLTQLQEYYQALQLCCWDSYAQGLLVWWRHLTSSIHQRRGSFRQDQLQAAEPYSAQQETNPQQLLEWLFHFIREPIKKKVSEQYNFYCLNYTLILKTVPKKTFH